MDDAAGEWSETMHAHAKRMAIALAPLAMFLCASAHGEIFRCVDAAGKVGYQDAKCAGDAKTERVLRRDAPQDPAATAANGEPRRVPPAQRPSDKAKAIAPLPAPLPSPDLPLEDRARNANAIAHRCGALAARGNACKLNTSAYQSRCHTGIVEANQRKNDSTFVAAMRLMVEEITAPEIKAQKFSPSECAAIRARLDAGP